MSTPAPGPVQPVAVVLGGGGLLGAAEVGMLQALLEHGVRPDLVLGTSVGAINGSMLAADPRVETVDRLRGLWTSMSKGGVFTGSALQRVGTLARTRTHAHDIEPLERLLRTELDDRLIEDLPIRFQCVAASIERAAGHWFTDGPVIDAVLASAAVPGLFPPRRIGDEHFVDGGLVDSIPVGRAVALGARTIWVCHVGRIERPLAAPRRPWEVAMVSFEIARRHRFNTDLATVPAGVDVHLLPSGATDPPSYADLSALRYRDTSRIAERIESAHRATADYLSTVRV